MDGLTEEKEHDYIGRATCNEAEYHALIRGSEVVFNKGCIEVEARGDSQLIVHQVRGDWQTKEPQLREPRDRVRELPDKLGQFEIRYIPREENREAGALVERAFAD